MEAFVDAFSLDFPQAADLDGSIWTGFGVVAQPAWAFVAADGEVEIVLGALGEAELGARIDTLVARG